MFTLPLSAAAVAGAAGEQASEGKDRDGRKTFLRTEKDQAMLTDPLVTLAQDLGSLLAWP
jgi:hypothetical protein